MVPIAVQFTLYACIFDRESYCHVTSICGIRVCVMLLDVVKLNFQNMHCYIPEAPTYLYFHQFCGVYWCGLE